MACFSRRLAMLPGLLVFVAASAYAQCGPRFVAIGGVDGPDCDQVAPCATIQHAVDVDADAGCSGDTVNVAAGTYTEQVTIDTVLNLVGTGATIQVPAPPVADTHDIVTIGAMANVELTGFTVSGPLPLPAETCNTLGAGIHVLPGGTANIHDNTIADVRHDPLDGCQEGNGIVAGTAVGGAAVTVTIVNNTVVHYQKNGITVRGPGSTATITGNTVTGEGPTTQLAQNGIQVSSGAIATVTGNTVSANECNVTTCGPDPETQDLATGILLFQPAAGTMVMGNTFTTNDVGIYNLAQGTTLKGNTLTDNRFHGVILDQGDATVDSNMVSGPIARTDCGPLAGITVLPAATANIHDNTIADVRHEPLDGCQAGNGIAAGIPGGAPITVTIANNTIVRYQKTGIVVRGASSTGTITGNTVTGEGPLTQLAQNGIQVSSGAIATVTGNTVSGNECNVTDVCGPDPLANTQSIGILLAGAGAGTTVMGNPVSANDIGIYNLADGATTLSGNTLMNNRFEGIVLDEGNAAIDSNTIDPGNVGILVVSFFNNTVDSTGTLTCNQISGALQAGIRLLQQDGGANAVATASNNNISGNVVGIDNTTTSSMNAIGNWWGCALGPGNMGCDTVSANVDASSPLPAPPTCPPPTTTTTVGPLTTTTAAATTTTVTPTTSTTLPTPPQCLSDASCGDGNICNGVEKCVAGVCIAGTPLSCNDGDPCTVDSCAPASGCQHTMVADLGSCSIVIPGGENRKADCYAFADVAGSHPTDNPKTLSCADGDPTCDMDGACNNVCDLKVRLCINSATLSPCTPPSELTSLKFKSHPARFTLTTPAQLSGAQCGAVHDVLLPVKLSKKGKKSTGVLKVTASAKAPKPMKPPTDKDTYIMKCVPGCAR
jgi:parallel beta-helix repeat protein